MEKQSYRLAIDCPKIISKISKYVWYSIFPSSKHPFLFASCQAWGRSVVKVMNPTQRKPDL